MLCVEPDAIDVHAILRAFAEQGYARLGVVASPEAMRARIDAIMLGRVSHEPFFFQHDAPSGLYEDLRYGQGWIGPSLNYRKVERLERDDVFWQWVSNPLFERIARTAMGGGPVTLYRALMFGKSADGGTELPWHQDGGVFWGLDREPFLQVWTALDDAGPDAGCLEVVTGSHKGGLTTPDGGVIPQRFLEDIKVTPLPAKAGEAILLHNHLWHRSRRNTTGQTRRAFTICYLDGRTRCLRKKKSPRQFVTVFP